MGKPASGVKVSLHCLKLDSAPIDGVASLELPHTLATGSDRFVSTQSQVDSDPLRETDVDGRCTNLLAPDFRLSSGIYKITFFTGPYFQAIGRPTFYPIVEVTIFVAKERAD